MIDKELQKQLADACTKACKAVPDGFGGIVLLWGAKDDRVENVAALIDGAITDDEDNAIRSDWATSMALSDLIAKNRRVYGIVSFALAECLKTLEEARKATEGQSKN